MTMPDSPHPVLADRPAPSSVSPASFEPRHEPHREPRHEPPRVQLPLGLRARDGRVLSESLLAHVPSTTGAVEPERRVVDRAQLSLFATRHPR
jgi:hypothetical protein